MRGTRCLDFPSWIWQARAALNLRHPRCSACLCEPVPRPGAALERHLPARKALGTGWAAALQGAVMEPSQQSHSACVSCAFPSRDPLYCRLLLPGTPCSVFFRLCWLISPLASFFFFFSLRGLSMCDREWETEASGCRVCHVKYVSSAVPLNYEKISPD